MIVRGSSSPEPARPDAVGRVDVRREIRPAAGHWTLGWGTLACPACDAPVALPGRAVSPADALGCPFCARTGAVRDFLSLAGPARPARVEIRVNLR